MISWSKPYLDKKDKSFLISAFNTSWISGGSYILKFENRIKKMFNRKYAFTTSNGTSAIHLALLSINFKKNDEIIIPAFGYLAAGNISKLMNLKVVFADVDKESYCLSLDTIKKKISKKTRAVVIINTYGNVYELKKIEKYLKRKNIILIEDAAESLGSSLKNKKSGSFGDISTFSFHATKNITTGEGGMILTNNKNFAKKIELYRSHGVKNIRYKHLVHGHNFRLSNLLAALGYSQSLKINFINKRKIKIYKLYLKYLDLKKIQLQYFDKDTNIIPWSFAITLKKRNLRNKLYNYLKNKGIETRKGFYSVDKIKLFKSKEIYTNSNFLSNNVICLPLHINLKNRDVRFISQEINNFLNR